MVQNIATLQPAEWFYFASNPNPPKAAKVYSHVDCLQNMAADAAMDTTCPSPEPGDSRKRPLDDGTDDGTSKRSHFSTNATGTTNTTTTTNGGSVAGVPGSDNYHFKTLVPSVAAGAIIGKGGETIASLQKDAGARVKMSKAHDFYPGCHETVRLLRHGYH